MWCLHSFNVFHNPHSYNLYIMCGEHWGVYLFLVSLIVADTLEVM